MSHKIIWTKNKMNLLDLYEQREPYQQAIDTLEQRRISDLEEKMDYLKKSYTKADSDEVRSAIKKRYNEYKSERDSYYAVKEAEQTPQQPPAKGLLKNKDLVTPQQRVAGATPQKPGMMGAVKDVVGGIKRFVKGEPDQGPTYEARSKKKSSNKTDDVQNLAVQRYLTKVRREHPSAYSDIEAISKHELDKEQKTQANLARVQQTQNSVAQQIAQANQVDQAQSQVIKDLENQVDTLSNTVKNISTVSAAPTEPTPTTPAPAVGMPVTQAPATSTRVAAQEPFQVPSQRPEEVPDQPKIDTAKLPKKDKKILPRVRKIQRSLEKRVDQYQTIRALKDTEKMEKMQADIADLQAKLDAETAKLSDQGQDVVQPSAQVIDIRDRLKGSGLDMTRTGTFGEQQSPVIGAMAQQLTKQPSPDEIYTRNMQAFTQAYEKTRGTKLNYGGSANIPLPFSDMDALVSTITAFPASQKGQIWKKLFTDPNYLNQFMDQYVEQRGLIEGDVINMAQQRQAPAQLKAYNLALEIMKAARDTRVSPAKVDQMKQILFKDFGTRIQKHPSGYYYITFQGRQVKLPDPETFSLEEHGGGIGPQQRWQDLMPETVTDVKQLWAQAYHKLAPKIERHRDSFLAGQLYDELENIAELHGAEREFKQMMNGARNRAHMEYDTNPGGFQNWFWFLPFEDEHVAEGDQWDSGDDVTVTHDDQSTTYQYKGYKFKVNGEEAQGEAWWFEPGDTWREADHYNYVYDESKGIDRFYNEDGQNVFNLSATNQNKVEQFVKAKAKDFVSTMVAQPNLPAMNEQEVAESTDDLKKRMSKLEALALAANRAGDDAKCKMYQQKIQSLKQKLSQSMAEGWSDAIVSRRTGQPRTPYSVYIKGKKWKDFANDDHARAVMDKLKAKFRADGRDPETVTIAPTDLSEDIVEGIRDTASATAVVACLLAGGSLSGCATAPQQTTAQQVLKTGQDVGRTVQTAKRITRAGAEEEVRQELRNLARGVSGQPGELNHSNILRIWRKIKGPSATQSEPQAPENYPAPPRQRMPQYEAREIHTREEFIKERDRLLRMITQETNPANKQILRSAIRQLENRAENEGWLAMQQRMIRETNQSSAAEDAILKRIFVAHKDLLVRYGPEKVMNAAEDVAYNVGDQEIGTSDVSGWVRLVEQILGARA
jgi:hypothetical protein